MDTTVRRGRPGGLPRVRHFAHRIIVWLVLAAGVLPIQAATLTAQLDRNVVPLGESVRLSLVFEGGAPSGSPRLPALPGVRVQPGISQRSEFSFVNGRQTSRQIYDYTLVPTQLGNVTIPALQIRVGNTVLTSRPLALRVVASTGVNAVTNLAFLRLVVPQKQIYLGEPFPVEMQLYIRSARDINRPELTAEGFSFSQPTQGQQTRTQISGVVFDVVTFKLAATPAKVGNLKLGPATCDLTLLIPQNTPQRRRDPFMDPFGFFGRSNVRRQRATLQSEIIPIQVLPLPADNVPPTFNGAVGQFTLTVTASPTEVSVGDPITVRARISGKGPIESLSLPAQADWKEFKTYPPTSETEVQDPLGLSGHKTFTQVLVPQNHELKSIPPLKFSYFDSAARSYRTLSGPAFPLTVHASANPAAPPPVLASNAPPRETPPADDILPIRTHLDGARPPLPFLAQQSWFLGVQSLPILAWLSLWFWRKHTEALANNPRLRRRREVAARVREGLKTLRVQASAGQPAEFFATLFRLLQEQIGERLDVPASAITEAVVEERLQGRNLPEETLNTLRELFQSCNLVRYAPTQSTQELEALLPRIESTLQSLRDWEP